jgi:hypothetical protein
MAKGGYSVDRMGGAGTVAQATALGFSIQRHTLAATQPEVSRRERVKLARNRGGYISGFEPPKRRWMVV